MADILVSARGKRVTPKFFTLLQSPSSNPMPRNFCEGCAHAQRTLPSKYSVQETISRLETLLHQKGLKIFAQIDHSGEAEKVSLKMNNTKLLIFGSPKAGTPLMQAAPTLAIDLPLKALIWEDGSGQVWLTYNDPKYLQQRHNFPPELLPNIAGAAALLQKALE